MVSGEMAGGAEIHDFDRVECTAPNDVHVENVSSDKPGNHEQAERNIARGLPSGILEHLGNVEGEIGRVHEAKDCVSDSVVGVYVGARDECDSDDVVREHLPVIRSTCFNVEDKELLDVKGARGEIVEFEQGFQAELRIVGPVLDRVQRPVGFARGNVETERPGTGVVGEGEALFSETKDFLLSGAEGFGALVEGLGRLTFRLAWLLGVRDGGFAQGEENEFHPECTEEGEEEDEGCYKESVIGAALIEVAGDTIEQSPGTSGDRMVTSQSLSVVLECGNGGRGRIGDRVRETEASASKVVKCCERVSETSCVAAEGTEASCFTDQV